MCVCVDLYYNKPFIELPDRNGYNHKYILNPYAYGYKNVISKYIKSINNETIYVSTNWKIDTQCFSNKCFNNICTYNIETNIKHYDIIYTKSTIFSFSEEEFYCGWKVGEYYTKDSNCSYKNCENENCSDIHYEPSDSDELTLGFIKFGLIIALLIISIVISCCCCCCFCECYKTKKWIKNYFFLKFYNINLIFKIWIVFFKLNK